QQLSSVIHVIENETYQSRGHDQGVPLDQTPLQQAGGIRKHARQNSGTVDTNAIDDPFVPPTGNCGAETSDPACGVDCSVDDVSVEPRGRFAESHHAETDVSWFATA